MALLCSKKTTSIVKRNNGDFYCLNCLHLFRAKKKNLNLIKKIRGKKDFCGNIMFEGTKIT